MFFYNILFHYFYYLRKEKMFVGKTFKKIRRKTTVHGRQMSAYKNSFWVGINRQSAQEIRELTNQNKVDFMEAKIYKNTKAKTGMMANNSHKYMDIVADKNQNKNPISAQAIAKVW